MECEHSRALTEGRIELKPLIRKGARCGTVLDPLTADVAWTSNPRVYKVWNEPTASNRECANRRCHDEINSQTLSVDSIIRG